MRWLRARTGSARQIRRNSLSIGAIEFDPTDAGHQTLVAGTGTFSSFGGEGATPAGLIRTTDGGAVWTAINGSGTLNGLNISGVAPRGATILIAVNAAPDPAGRGIWQSTDTGATWKQISGAAGTNLPRGAAADLAGDPSDPSRLFTNAGTRGLFRSTTTGATWSKVSDAAMDALLVGADHVKLAVGTANNVFVAIVRGDALAGVFRSGNGGDTWTSINVPQTIENGNHVGIHPGGQGGTHLSIAADRGNPQLVYLGGDRQPSQFNNLHQETGFFPNSLGAQVFDSYTSLKPELSLASLRRTTAVISIGSAVEDMNSGSTTNRFPPAHCPRAERGMGMMQTTIFQLARGEKS